MDFFQPDVLEQKMDRFDHITRSPFSVKITRDGHDITSLAGVREVHYKRDGSGTRTLADGTIVAGTWHFLDAAQTIVETAVAGKRSRFRIVELTDAVYRKVDLETGVEIAHYPKLQ